MKFSLLDKSVFMLSPFLLLFDLDLGIWRGASVTTWGWGSAVPEIGASALGASSWFL